MKQYFGLLFNECSKESCSLKGISDIEKCIEQLKGLGFSKYDIREFMLRKSETLGRTIEKLSTEGRIQDVNNLIKFLKDNVFSNEDINEILISSKAQ